MPSAVDTSKWSGEGAFTQTLIDELRSVDAIRALRVEDAPATRSEADYNFISNEVFVEFGTVSRQEPTKRLGILPGTRTVTEKAMTMAALEQALGAVEGIG